MYKDILFSDYNIEDDYIILTLNNDSENPDRNEKLFELSQSRPEFAYTALLQFINEENERKQNGKETEKV